MKKITFLVFIICSSLVAYGDSGDSNKLNIGNRFCITLSLGPSFPGNSFGVPTSYHLTGDTVPGFAKTGFHFGLTPKIYLTPHFGLVGLIGGNLNSLNTTAYNSSITYNESRTSSTQAGSYYCGEYMGGLFLSFQMLGTLSNVSFHLAVMCGDITATFPTITTTFSASATQSAGEATFSANNAHSFGGNLNTGFDVKINQHIIVSLDISYSFAYLEYPSGTYTQNLQNGSSLTAIYSTPITMSLGLIKPTLGIGYVF